MSSQPSDSSATSATPAGEQHEHDLLRLLCCIAWSDGAVSERERELLERLAREVLLPDQPETGAEVSALVSEAMGLPALDALIPRIEGHDQKQLALKLAYMVIRISREPGESSSINAREKVAYRRLVEGLELPEGEVQEAEWAAEQDLKQHSGLWSLLSSRFAGLGAWPDDALLASPELPRL